MAIALQAGCGPSGAREEAAVSNPRALEQPEYTVIDSDQQARRFQEFFGDFREAVSAGQVREVYADDAHLNDTLRELEGVDAIEAYFQDTVEATTLVRVYFEDLAVSGENYYFRWVMDFQTPKLNGGEIVRSQGMSHVIFDDEGKVTLHQDYWDSASGLYQHVPLLGGIIDWVRGRM